MKEQQGETKKESNILKSTAVHELCQMTYLMSEDEIDYDKLSLLIKLASSDDTIPDRYKANVFLKRFLLHYETEHESESEDEIEHSVNRKARFTKAFKILCIVLLFTVLVVFTCTRKVIMHDSEYQSVFQILYHKAMSFYQGEIDSDYIPEFSIFVLEEDTDKEAHKEFLSRIYLPKPSTEWFYEEDSVKWQENEVGFSYHAVDSEHRINVLVEECIEIIQGYTMFMIASDSVLYEYYFVKEDVFSVMNIHYSEESGSVAYMMIDEILYYFRFYEFKFNEIMEFIDGLDKQETGLEELMRTGDTFSSVFI